MTHGPHVITGNEAGPIDAHNAEDARLIASAPELYDTLKRIAEMTCDHGAGEFCPRTEARAAIRKAQEG
jgi:hypothetical protein